MREQSGPKPHVLSILTHASSHVLSAPPRPPVPPPPAPAPALPPVDVDVELAPAAPPWLEAAWSWLDATLSVVLQEQAHTDNAMIVRAAQSMFMEAFARDCTTRRRANECT
jgi:hypothetical protein